MATAGKILAAWPNSAGLHFRVFQCLLYIITSVLNEKGRHTNNIRSTFLLKQEINVVTNR